MDKNPPTITEYEQGFLHGYQKAIEDYLNGELRTSISGGVEQLPLDALPFSSGARNCLKYAGRLCLGDVGQLSEMQIVTMRNLGVKTASEIAEVLWEHGLYHTHWTRYRNI